MSMNNSNRLGITNVGVDVFGDLSYSGSFSQSSDFNLKENNKEMDTKKCLEVLEYINPKTFNCKNNDKKRCGCIAQDWVSSKLPDDWDIAFKDATNNFRLDSTKASVMIFGAVKE